MALTAEPVELSEIVRTTAESFTPAVLAKRQTVQLDLAPQARITGDAHRLRQVIWNLLSNATKFTPEGGTITVRVARSGLTGGARGHAIPARGSTRRSCPTSSIVSARATAARRGDTAASDSGLSLVRHLVEAHGGTVSAGKRRQRARARRSRVRLPARVEAPAAGRGGIRSDARAIRYNAPLTHRTIHMAVILNVEDDSPSRFLKSRILERAGFQVARGRDRRRRGQQCRERWAAPRAARPAASGRRRVPGLRTNQGGPPRRCRS